MTEESKEAPEQAVPPQEETARQVQPDDIKTPDDLRQLLVTSEKGLLEFAQKKMQSTGYQEAVRVELTLHKGDMHQFALHRLVDLLEKQSARIDMLETLFIKAAKNVKEN